MFDRRSTQRTGRMVVRGAVGAAVVVLGVGGLAGTASAQETPPQGVDGNVAVSSAIALTGLTPSFTLTGVPGATVAGVGAVTYNVATNDVAGYTVTVQSTTAVMDGTAPNADTIPIGALSVRESGTTTYTALSNTVPATVHSQATRSAPGGDALSSDYQVVIPFVNSDTYDATLNYVAATL